VRETKWKNGTGDVLKELSDACKEYGLKFGVYISPWDRNHPDYGTDKYNDVFVNMMKEIFANYGPIWELWWDGANGEGPNGKKQVYDWKRFESTVRKLSPSTVIFSDIGPDIRWVGNENGIAGETNWNYLDTAGFMRGQGAPPTDTLNSGNRYGSKWIPAECDVSIRPGWFYHADEDDKVKTPEQLFDLYLKSVGRGANLLLNVPPDRRGLISEHDSTALAGFEKLRDQNFRNDIMLTGFRDGFKERSPYNDHNDNTYGIFSGYHVIEIGFKKQETINCIVVKEFLPKGQHCAQLAVLLKNGHEGVKEFVLTTVGHKRIITFPAVKATSIRCWVESAYWDENNPVFLSSIEAYNIDEKLIEKK
jgi:alpha-L-fucosidase